MAQKSDREIATTALLVIEHHGANAGPYAASRVVELEKNRAHADALKWMKILAAIHRLQDLGAAHPTRH